MNARTSRNTRGFTLVELLIVITIIGVLAALAAGGAMYVQGKAREAMTKTQVGQMEMALEQYKNEYGEYPPLLSDQKAVERHAASRWKRASVTYADILAAAGLPAESTAHQRIAATLTFWLGGHRDTTGTYTGFSADVANPLKIGGQRAASLFDFNEKNTLPIGGTTAFCYAVFDKPVVYFRSTSLGDAMAYMQKPAEGDGDKVYPLACDMGEFGVAVPYAKTFTGNLSGFGWTPADFAAADLSWYGAKKFQLIHPGRNALFADPELRYDNGDAGCKETWFACVGTGDGITYEDNDNITNFTDTATLEGAMNQ